MVKRILYIHAVEVHAKYEWSIIVWLVMICHKAVKQPTILDWTCQYLKERFLHGEFEYAWDHNPVTNKYEEPRLQGKVAICNKDIVKKDGTCIIRLWM